MAEVVVITGASAGIGRATARESPNTAAGRSAARARPRGAQAAAREVEELGGEAVIIPTDVADYEAVERAADQIVDSLRPGSSTWVNNAFAGIFSGSWT